MTKVKKTTDEEKVSNVPNQNTADKKYVEQFGLPSDEVIIKGKLW